jgi:hypothetical protein
MIVENKVSLFSEYPGELKKFRIFTNCGERNLEYSPTVEIKLRIFTNCGD